MNDFVTETTIEQPSDNDNMIEQSSDNKIIWIIVAVGLLLVCCCVVFLAFAGVWLWYNGDALLGLATNLPPVLPA